MSTVEVRAPYDNKLLDTLELQSKESVQEAITLAHNYFNDYDNRLKKYEIIEIFEKAIVLMKDRMEELTTIALNEGGKPYVDSKVEVYRAIDGIKVAIDHIKTISGREIPMGHTQSSSNRVAMTFFEPIGVVAAVSAFNHPLNLTIHQVIPAIAVGAPVIIKPATLTPMSALNFVNILYEAGLPKALCQVVVCARDVGEYLVKSPQISFLTFIGSSQVGWHLNKEVANGTRVALEHGGVAPVIIDKDASIKNLLPLIAKGGFYHAGQVCVSVQRVFVHENIIDEVSAGLVQIAKALKVGDPALKETEVGPIISAKELDRIALWVDESINDGATLLCGGNKISASLYEATILLNPSKKSLVSTKEVFGPVICLYTFNDIEDAYDEANALEVSFQASVFSSNIDTALRASRRLNATAVMVNDHTAFRVDWMPFAGAKSSGLGIGGIPYSMHEMSVEKMLVIKSNGLV